MALTGALVDRARTLDKVQAGVRVEGRTPLTTVRGTWFKCRLFLTQAAMATDDQQGKWSSVSKPQLMYGVKDTAGQPVELEADMRVEVDSKELGRAIWRMTGEVEPLRRRRSVLGFITVIERVIEREFDVLLTDAPLLTPDTASAASHATALVRA